MSIEALLAPINADNPCGENLEYDADFMAMEQACLGKAEQQFGNTIIPAQAADWVQVEQLATSLLTRTKDLRVMLALTRAWTQLKGLPGYAKGLQLIKQAVVLYWQSLYPALEFDGEQDPLFRINVLADLGDKSSLTQAMRQSMLLKSVTGEISLRDAYSLIDGSKTEFPDYPGGRTRLLDELAQGGQPGIDAVLSSRETLETLCETLVAYLGESGLPQVTQLRKTLDAFCQFCQPQAVMESDAPQGQEMAAEAAEVSPVRATAPVVAQDWRRVALTNREDAKLMLEKVKQYFQQHESSHPAPLLIERVERLIEMDFMGIVRDLAPDSVNQLTNIFGRNNS
jgi:type VI secretion system protein ImpA